MKNIDINIDNLAYKFKELSLEPYRLNKLEPKQVIIHPQVYNHKLVNKAQYSYVNV
jgi:hypothetical protein